MSKRVSELFLLDTLKVFVVEKIATISLQLKKELISAMIEENKHLQFIVSELEKLS